MPYFWDKQGNMLSQEAYHSLLVQKKSEEEKFDDPDKHLKGQNIVENLNKDFDLLS